MAVGEKRLRELALELAKHMGPAAAAPTKLRLVPSTLSPASMDPLIREAHLRRIRHLRAAYRLGWLVDQETLHLTSMYALDDDGVSALLSMMEKARECMYDGIPFDDAGLVRSVAIDLRNAS